MTTGFAPSVYERAEKERRKTRFLLKCVFICAFVLFIALICITEGVAYAATSDAQENLESDLSDSVDSTIDRLDSDMFEDFIASLGEHESQAVGIKDLKDALKSMTQGEPSDFFGSFMSALASALGSYFLGFLPGFISVIVICLLKSMLAGMSSGFKNASTGEVVHVVCYSAVIVILAAAASGVIVTVTDTINALASFADAVFPVLLTLLAAVGGSSGVALYQPFMAVLSGTIIKLVQSVIVPAFIATIVFSVVGNVSKNVKLDKLTKLFKSGAGWLIGIVFGLFATFLTAQGITGGVLDKLSFNAAKFAVSSYVPILGGYLSDGFDLLTASMVLVKNAVGVTGVVVLVAVVLFPLLQLASFILGLRLTAAVVEPIGDTRTASVLGSLADNAGLLVTALVGVGFMFFVIIMLCIGSFNPGV